MVSLVAATEYRVVLGGMLAGLLAGLKLNAPLSLVGTWGMFLLLKV